MRFQIPVFQFGTLKIKSRDKIRTIERQRLPMIKIGGVYIIWWSKSADAFMGPRGRSQQSDK
jgi:hypothetical protein